MTVTVLWHRWFVQYNPFYLASSLFVLGGVYLVTRNPADWDSEQLLLAGVLQLYELALIAAAAFLFVLPHQRRPAVILGIVAIAFLFDITFRLEGISSVAVHALPAAAGWLALLAIKLRLLMRALRVQVPFPHLYAWMLGGAMIAVAPQVLADGMLEASSVLIAACWLGIGLSVLALVNPPQVECTVELDGWGRTVLARIARMAPVLWAALYWLHVGTWIGIHGLKLTAICFAPLVVLLPLATRSPLIAWVVSGIALGVAAGSPAGLGAVAALLAFGLAVQAWRIGSWSLSIAAAMHAYLALWKLSGLAIVPATPWAWGATLLAGAFAALGCGVALNWWSARIATRIASASR